jgi:hypothetical protein
MAHPPIIKVRPREFKGFLLNPHKGCETFQRFNGDPLYEGQHYSESGPTEFPPRKFEGVTPGYLPSTVSYCRWFWNLFEPEKGRYDFTVIEGALETAASRGQTLHLRLQPHGAPSEPEVPAWYVARYKTTPIVRYRGTFLAPEYDSPEFLDAWGGLIAEFGRRFDGDPRLEAVDVSYIGPWGEGDGECSEAGVERMTKVYCDAIRRTPKLAMIGGHQMRHGVRAGMGWRCDSCDDLGFWGDPNHPLTVRWNHLYDSYPWSVAACGATDAWKTAPVAYEPGRLIMSGYEKGFDLDFIIRQDLKYHGSLISMKSTVLPEPWMEKLLAFCNDLGYRFVLRQFRADLRAKPGQPFNWGAWIENVGVAPIYRRYAFALRATQGNRVHYIHSPAEIRTWLPGDGILREAFTLPKEFQPGAVMLHAALVDPATNVPKVRFAVEGTEADGWLPLDKVEVEAAS